MGFVPLFNFTKIKPTAARAFSKSPPHSAHITETEKNMSEKKPIAAHVRELCLPVCAELGLDLWDVEYVKEGADYILRITIDSAEGVTIDDCERMTRAIDPILDEDDPIENSYRLEVSSPGVERTLSRPEHFAAMMGAEVEVKLFSPVNGSKTHRGTLSAYDGGDVTVTSGEDSVTFKKADVAKVSTVFEW